MSSGHMNTDYVHSYIYTILVERHPPAQVILSVALCLLCTSVNRLGLRVSTSASVITSYSSAGSTSALGSRRDVWLAMSASSVLGAGLTTLSENDLGIGGGWS